MWEAAAVLAPPNVHDGLPRFAILGHALRNVGHPDHGFALHFASLLLSAPGVETDAYLEKLLRQDQPPALFERAVDAAAAVEIFMLVFGRRPEADVLETLLAEPLTGEQLLRRLLASHEFRVRRARIAWG